MAPAGAARRRQAHQVSRGDQAQEKFSIKSFTRGIVDHCQFASTHASSRLRRYEFVICNLQSWTPAVILNFYMKIFREGPMGPLGGPPDGDLREGPGPSQQTTKFRKTV